MSSQDTTNRKLNAGWRWPKLKRRKLPKFKVAGNPSDSEHAGVRELKLVKGE